MSAPVNTSATDIVFPGRNYGHLAFEKRAESAKTPPSAQSLSTGDTSTNQAKSVDPEHVRTRAYFLWLNQRNQYASFTAVDFWLLAERIEKYYA